MKSLQLDKPHAIVVVGVPGSGKTFFAEKFSDTFSAPYFDMQAISRLARDEAAARTLFSNAVSEVMKTSNSMLLELPVATRTERTELVKKLRDAGYKVLLVWVQTDTTTAMSRSRKMSGTSPEEYKDSIRRFSPPHDTEDALVISGKHTFASQAKAVLKKLSSTNRTVRIQSERPSEPAHHRGSIIVR